jgi:ethanolamine utilization protein EutA (predicted chaperonin)
VPVVHIVLDAGQLDRERTISAIRSFLEEIDLDNRPGITMAFTWRGDPEHARLRAAAEAIVEGLQPAQKQIKLLVLAIDGDIGKTFGRLMHRELDWPGKIIGLDGVELHELDYIDVGELIAPPGVVPVVIKSLLFA